MKNFLKKLMDIIIMDYSKDNLINFDRNLHLNYLKEINGDDIVKYNDVINPQTDIIICVPEKEQNVHINNHGGLSLTPSTDVNLTQLVSNTFFNEYKLVSQLKISTPYGIHLNYIPSIGNGFVNSIYPNFEIINRSFNFNPSDNRNDDDFIFIYTIYNSFSFQIYLDSKQYRNSHASLIMSKNISLVDLYFNPIIHIQKNGFSSVNNIYYIRNDEYFKSFEEIY